MALETLDPERILTTAPEPGDRPVAFLFPGQGAQYPGMGRGLYDSEPSFRDDVDLCCRLLQPLLGLDLRAALFEEGDAASGRLQSTQLAQPALFVVSWATARLWMSWGVRPEAMLGHSIGEYVAACLAGVFSLEDALAVVAVRGRLMAPDAAGRHARRAAPRGRGPPPARRGAVARRGQPAVGLGGLRAGRGDRGAGRAARRARGSPAAASTPRTPSTRG